MNITTGLSTLEYRGLKIKCYSNIVFIDLEDIEILINRTYNKHVSDLHLTQDKSRKTCKKLLLHSFLLETCEVILFISKNYPGYKVIIYINSESSTVDELYNDAKAKVLKFLPGYIITSDISASNFIDNYTLSAENSIAKYRILMDNAIDSIYSWQAPSNKFYKFREFLKRNDLVYLYDVYFRNALNRLIVA